MGCESELLKKAAKPIAARKLNLPKGVPPLTSLYMYISGSCNLACRHCWISPTYEPDNSKGQFLKLEYIKKAVREAKPLGLQSVKLTGGEPMLHPQIREIITYLESQNINMIMETNGTLINAEMASFLKSKPHFNFISVSVDGAKATTHDKLRGVKGSFKQAIAGIKSLVKAGFKPQMICTLHRGNLAELEEVIKLAEKLGCGSIKFNHVHNMGRGDVFSKMDILSNEELLELYNKIGHDIRPHHRIVIHFDMPIAFQPIRKLVRDPLCQCVVLNLLGILATGQLSLCGVGVTVPELIYGDISQDALKKVWRDAPGLLDLRAAIPFQIKGICRDCLHRGLCLGQCVANNYHDTQSLRAPYYFCQEMEESGLFPKSRKKI